MAALFPILLNDRWRVSMIDNPPQWTLERKALLKGAEVWQAKSFCQTRDGLLRAIREKVVHGAEFYKGGKSYAVNAHNMARIADFPPRVDRQAGVG